VTALGKEPGDALADARRSARDQRDRPAHALAAG
jgi:hypothetical protein